MNTTTAPRTFEGVKTYLQSPYTVIVVIMLLVAALDPGNTGPVLRFMVQALLSTLPYIIFAVFLIAGLKASGAEALIAEAFKGREVRMIMLAAMFGGLAPFCSCEVIPFIAGLLALGAPLSAVMAFWLSSPLIDPPTLLITAGALGWPFAVGKAIAAVSLGLAGGFILRFLVPGNLLSNPLKAMNENGCGCGPNPFNGKTNWTFWRESARRTVFRAEFKQNALFLLKWLALAYTLEAVLVTYVPASLIARVVGGEGVGPVVVAALVGMPAYLNSYVAPPLLAGLMEQGMTAGAAMSFMIAGAVSSIPAMAAVWSLVKAKVFALYLGIGVVGAIVSGLIFQLALGTS